MKQILFVRAQNQPAVLPRICRLLAMYGFPVESLLFQVSPDPAYVQLTVTPGAEPISGQVIKLLRRMIEVVEVKIVPGG